jgi:DNA polymerase I-like protein with 3'-5' exonuclease and polymerase domains
MPRFKRYEYDRMGLRALRQFEQDSPPTIAVDTETYGFAWDDPAFCVTVTWRDAEGRLRSCYLDLDFDDHGSRLAVAMVMLETAPHWVFHNAKFDLQKLILAGVIDRALIDTKVIEDTNIIHALIDENDRHGLKYLAGKLLGESTNEEKVLARVRRKLKLKKDDGYHLLPREVVVPYAMKDTELTLKLYDYLRPKLPEDCVDLYAAEIQTALALLDIEANGIAIDVPYLTRTKSEYGKLVMRGYMALQTMAADESVPKGERKEFNPNSPKQIMEAFARLGMELKATDKATLAEVAETWANHKEAAELALTLLTYRKNKKLHATYLVGMLDEQRDGVLHPNFNLTLPRTGRMSSSAASNN